MFLSGDGDFFSSSFIFPNDFYYLSKIMYLLRWLIPDFLLELTLAQSESDFMMLSNVMKLTVPKLRPVSVPFAIQRLCIF